MNNKLNYKLLNFLLGLAVVVLLYLIRDLWIGIVSKIFSILAPFIVAFAIAYAIYPLCKKLQNAGLPKWLSIFLICFIGIGIFIICIILIIPIVYEQTLLFLSNISAFISDISTKYALNLGGIQTSLSDITANMVKSVGSSISNGAINVLNSSISVLVNLVIILFVSIYFLIDMEKTRHNFKNFLLKKNRRAFEYTEAIDKETTNYFSGLGKVILIQLIEYTFAFFIIGHPNYLILGILAAITTIIPYFGGLIVNIIAILIASVISTKLLVLTIIVCLICPQIDGYIISPTIYGKTNKVPPLIVIFSVYAGGLLAGFWGIVVSLPLAIIAIASYKFFKEDINEKIDKMKKGKKVSHEKV